MKKLPIVATPEYSITLPSSGKKVKIRPFMAQEEKILLMALESGKEDEIKDALKQIINNCILTQGVGSGDLPSIDVEKIFLELRKRSVSETIDLKFDLREVFECSTKECPEKFKVIINLNELELKNLSKEKKIITLSDTVGVTLKHLTIDAGSNDQGKTKTEALYGVIVDLIDDIFDGDEVYNSKEYKKEDLIKWVETSFQHTHLEQIIDFLNNQPYYSKSFEIKCSLCGQTKIQEAKGLVDFFI